VLPELPLAFAGSRVCDHIHDPGAARPVRLDVLRSFFRSQRPDGVTSVAFLMIRCHERDVPLAFELAGNLAAQGPLIVFDGQTDVGPGPIRCLQKNPVAEGVFR
jgi:hypothetical protein